MTDFYTYFHTRNDTGAVFYVGKGKNRRAHRGGRNSYWRRVSGKHGHTIHIAAHWETEQQAFEHEKFLILCFKDMGVKLTNMTDGGEGRSGWVPSQEFRDNVSLRHSGKVTPSETRAKMSVAMRLANSTTEVKARRVASWTPERRSSASLRGRQLIHYAYEANVGKPGHMKGKHQSDETKAKIGAASSGENNPMYGRNFNHTDETKAKIAEASRLRVITPEARLNTSLSAKAAWARRKEQTSR